MAKTLTLDHIVELECLRRTTDALKGPSFIHRLNWRGLYATLVRQGLVVWRPHPRMGPKFRETELTPKARKLLETAEVKAMLATQDIP